MLKLIILFSSVFSFEVTSQAYIGGSYPGSDFSSTVKLENYQVQCTAAKIGEKVYLTAAHCNLFAGLEPGSVIDIKNYKLGTTSGPLTQDIYIKTKVAKLHLHPSWVQQPADHLNFSDLALVEVEDASNLPNVSIALKPLSSSDKIVVGGYGCKGQGYPAYSHLSVAVKAIQELYDINFTTGIQDFDDKKMSFGCAGDSGGPVYRLNSKTKEFEVVGVNGRVSTNPIIVDPKSGELLSFETQANSTLIGLSGPFNISGDQPHFFHARTSFDTGKDVLKTSDWLKAILPITSFTE